MIKREEREIDSACRDSEALKRELAYLTLRRKSSTSERPDDLVLAVCKPKSDEQQSNQSSSVAKPEVLEEEMRYHHLTNLMNPFEARELWPPGTVVDRKYIIDATLGRGSFGTAYRCHHRVLARTYVIKLLHSQFAEDPNYIQKFTQEARAIERLRGCPQIVEIYDMTQTEDGKLILVMEHMVGGDLEALIRRTGRFRIEDAVWYALQIAQGLAAAHAAGIVHRDVKPENVLLGADPREAKLTDFGIAADRDVASPTSIMRGGSVGYAAPEQWHLAGKYLDGRADLYSLGVTLYRMIAGCMPFGDVEIGEWIERVRTTYAAPLRGIRPDVPEPLERLIAELLSADRDQRPGNAQQVIERLRVLHFPERPPTVEERPQPLYAAPPPPSPQPPLVYQAPQQQQPFYPTQPPQPQQYYAPLPLPPPPPLPKSKSRAWLWVSLSLIAVIAAGGWFISEHRPPKRNPQDGLTYVWIGTGKFSMGCNLPECRPNELAVHEVVISKGFYLGQTETTVDAYRRFVAAKGARMPQEPFWNSTALNPNWASGTSPMNMISWNEAAKYCEWIGGRLPTESEWEYAARAGSTSVRYEDLEKIAWYADNAGNARIDALTIFNTDNDHYEDRVMKNGVNFHPVALKAPNAFGLYDMIGNVWEWVADYYDDKYPATAIQDPSGPGKGEQRLGRGGSYYVQSRRNTASARSNQKPDYTNPGFGFRCAWDAPLF